MRPYNINGSAAVWLAMLAGRAAAACSSNLVIDNFSNSNTNNLGWWRGDDGSMTSLSISNGKVTFKPKSGSYFYESFDCQAASSNGYTGVQFTIQGPAGGGVAVELQYKSQCDGNRNNYQSAWYWVSGLTGQTQTITIPWSSWSGANGNAIVGLVWSGFSSTSSSWSLDDIALACSSGGGGSTPIPTTLSTSTRTSTTSSTRTSTSTTRTSTSTTQISTSSSAAPTGTCSHLVVDDWTSQSRLTFLGYNALGASSSDDGTMNSVTVSNNRLTLVPKNTASYFYSQFNCVSATNVYGGLVFRVRANAGSSFSITLKSFSNTCGGSLRQVTRTTTQLGWTFDGTEKVYSFPWSAFPNIDTARLNEIYISGLSSSIRLGPIAFYCGNTPTEYTVPSPSTTYTDITVTTTSYPTPTASSLVIDEFTNANTNSLGQWHGADDGMALTFGNRQLRIQTNSSDLSFYTTFTTTCLDLTSWRGGYLHIAYSGNTKFSVALQQHNSACDSSIAPFPETWDSVEAERYAKNGHIYIPLNHFDINFQRVIAVALKGFYTADPVTLTKIEFVRNLPSNWGSVAPKLASGRYVFACTRPNSFAFAIDDGDPVFTKRVMDIINDAGITVTFFTVGLPLLDYSNGLAAQYAAMAAKGHQIALHSFTHPPMEGLPSTAAIDWEYVNMIGAVRQAFNNTVPITPYFRPPFGTEGARMRQRLAAVLQEPEPYLVGWSVDVEDWLWAWSSTPEKQLEAFQRDFAKGGNLLVMHYLHESTVNILPQMINIVKASGKQIMRVDQCLQDPAAPPL
ncbi:hydrolase-like protein [Thermochaetoides thermophila DSM 1495]|uniref:Hydrolase-like protein n=1 Tax=Chaetomium thermophilum (strain DSM 1495 / CBS 144.50 / IMI 039719) TaxID=759272 RepID=G0S3X4_CHATD|nr:hydrolase-like protein [Thermochaetoides thermophila DSM 1495]EGS22036.1 hydrolase-like protein [Thermochaetoides thermophila DSM 1495]